MKDATVEARSERLVARTRDQLQRFAQETDVPLLAGPWLGEIAFELLYWLPYLQWVVHEFPVLRNRLVVMSRGGAGAWYQGIAWRYLDVFDFLTLREFRSRFPKFVKQTAKYEDYQKRSYPAGEEALMELARREVGVDRLNVLHPSMMYETFKHLRATNQQWLPICYRQLSPPAVPEVDARLPPQFVAARFYSNFSFPRTPANETFAQSVVQQLAKVTPVVLLNTAVQFDRKHADLPLAAGGNVLTMADLMTAGNNLAVQSAIVARATAFVGSYGGTSFLAPYYGRPSFAMYSDPDAVRPHHRVLAETALGPPNLGGYRMVHVDEISPDAVADMVLGAANPTRGTATKGSAFDADEPMAGQRVAD